MNLLLYTISKLLWNICLATHREWV